MKVLFCSSEVYPYAKTGGLADVAGALPLALGESGIEVKIVMPLYKGITVKTKPNDEFASIRISKNVELVLIKNDKYFMRDGLYGSRDGDWPDNLDRFAFYSQKALFVAQKLKFKPDIVHLNDWQSALVAVYLKTLFRSAFFAKSKCVLTVHNLAYQGVFEASEFEKLGIPEEYFSMDFFEFYGKLNILKAGIVFSDIVTTVSPTYSREIQTEKFGCGLEGVLRQKKERLYGILNAIDYSVWNPKTDAALPAPYAIKTIHNKKENKFALQKELKLEKTNGVPLIGMVTRIAHQKGFDIFLEALPSLIPQVQFVILGAGDKTLEERVLALSKRYPKKISVQLKFDEKLAHKIYAASDFFLMPSQFEPCGLSQLISFKYGTVPIVHRTGGLADTVLDYLEDRSSGNGVVFHQYNAEDLLRAVKRAQFLFSLPEWGALIKKVMHYNFSWQTAAAEYVKRYKECLQLP